MSYAVGKDIASETLKALGGTGRLSAMIGAKDFVYSKDGAVRFRFKMCKNVNMALVSLNGLDLYDLKFMRVNTRKFTCDDVDVFENIYVEDLKRTFEAYTGLYLTL